MRYHENLLNFSEIVRDESFYSKIKRYIARHNSGVLRGFLIGVTVTLVATGYILSYLLTIGVLIMP
jgi:hypothetical protein